MHSVWPGLIPTVSIPSPLPQAFSSITYLPLHTRIYKRWLQQHWVAREWDHWLMMALIGFFVGLLGSTLKICIEHLTEAKFEHASHLLREGRFGLMWFVTVLTSMALACASAVVVVKGEPAAGGSGIPDVMAYLNGVSIRRVRAYVLWMDGWMDHHPTT